MQSTGVGDIIKPNNGDFMSSNADASYSKKGWCFCNYYSDIFAQLLRSFVL
jgi:hypothetical protein